MINIILSFSLVHKKERGNGHKKIPQETIKVWMVVAMHI